MSFPEKLEQKVHVLQRADLKTKRRWLVVLSALSMLLVLALWLVYLNLTLPHETGTKAVAGEASSTASLAGEDPAVPPARPPFFTAVSRGLDVLRERISSQVGRMKRDAESAADVVSEQIGKTNTFSVTVTSTPSGAPAAPEPAALSSSSVNPKP